MSEFIKVRIHALHSREFEEVVEVPADVWAQYQEDPHDVDNAEALIEFLDDFSPESQEWELCDASPVADEESK